MRNISASFVLGTFLLTAGLGGTVLPTTGCGGSGGGGSGGTGGGGAATCFDYSSFDGKTPAVSFKKDVLPTFQVSCGLSLSCHQDPGAGGPSHLFLGPNMSTTATATDIQNIIKGLVGVGSYTDPKDILVVAGDPSKSFLMYKMDGEVACSKLDCSKKGCGVPMPQGGDTLGQAQRDAVRRWIAQGAQNN